LNKVSRIIDAVDRVIYEKKLLAIIIHSDYSKEGIEFFTPNDFSQQLAYMNRPAGYAIAPHLHNKVQREVFYTQEVLFIKKGKVKIDFYDDNRHCIDTRILETGDVILLASGGHGFEMLEPTEMIEVKQGPYAGEDDKTRF
jgi:mannose-6-phosphate isomerase-like protein (cupin superfamily)